MRIDLASKENASFKETPDPRKGVGLPGVKHEQSGQGDRKASVSGAALDDGLLHSTPTHTTMNPEDTEIANSLRTKIKISTGGDIRDAIRNYKDFLCAVEIRENIENPCCWNANTATGFVGQVGKASAE